MSDKTDELATSEDAVQQKPEAQEAGDREPLSFVHRPAEPDHPGIDFTTLIISLATSALFHLGAQLPSGEKGEVNHELAANSIDTLVLLEKKTRGNLTSDEAQMLSTLLYDLRLRYVAHIQRRSS